MNKKLHSTSLSLFFAFALLLSACAPAAGSPPGGEQPTEPGAQLPENTQPPADTPGTVGIAALDVCDIATEADVEAAFNAEVTAVTPQAETIGTECEFAFAIEGTQLRITSYEGNAAKQYFSTLIAAADRPTPEEGCESFFQALFEVGFGESATGEDLSGTSLSDLYMQYIAVLGSCMYVHTEPRPEIGDNVVATEVIYLNWSSNVAVLGNERVVEFTYQENIPADALANLNTATDKDSFYALADPYREDVLAGYTEILLGLVQAAVK